jgi:hypothetical protein
VGKTFTWEGREEDVVVTLRWVFEILLRGWVGSKTGSGSCPMMGFGNSGDEQ